jgi:hypothetical protein
MLRHHSLLLTVLACALTAPSPAAHVQSADVAKQFAGAWKLVSWANRMGAWPIRDEPCTR